MKAEDAKLLNLLNDDSFVRWMKNSATKSEKMKWNQWLLNSAQNQQVFQKARKFLNMPFKTQDVKNDVSEELKKLKEQISNLNSQELTSDQE